MVITQSEVIRMTIRKEAVFGVRLTPELYERYKALAAARFSTMSTIGRILVERLLKGEILL
ncbi:hypothetical protein MBAV_002073 [Candidatus Magnetobacterium bavaricum]|uniref:Uncharacterized protein n=1 Tax=Candidatus Magnetobacterium bavaricum TaxID=29290 RepID=A0A0F3GV19_9BACT|nr:hypothetical protein MBAV_002071 [Candidatus Magnetobacterium bavaricum]KJU85735.1 hypothetical protein MBAV_002073 [Candidatus Magnetobacterium bavaricum]